MSGPRAARARSRGVRLVAGASVLAAALLLAGYPLVGSASHLALASVIGAYAIAVVGLDLVVGRAGMLHAGFGVAFSFGAYAVVKGALLWPTVPTGLLVLLGGALSAASSFLIGLLVVRFAGVLFVLLTLSTAAFAQAVVQATSWLGGTSGLGAGTRNVFGNGQLLSSAVYVVILVVLAGLVAMSLKLRRSRVGRALAAARSAPHLAEASGIHLPRLRLVALIVGGAVAGIGGGFFGVVVQYVSPDNWGVQSSVNFLIMNVVGGQGVPWSGVPGAGLVRGLPQFASGLGDLQLLVVGAALSVVVVWFPRGVAGSLVDMWNWLRGRLLGAGPSELAELSGAVRFDEVTAPVSLSVAGVSVWFGGVRALTDVALEVVPGRVTALIGPNGAGKSTLVNVVAGGVPPAAGKVTLDGRDLAGLSPARRSRAGVARTFQMVSLCEDLTVLENVMLGGHTRSRFGLVRSSLPLVDRRTEAATAAAATRLLGVLGIRALSGLRPDRLSSGQRRLVEIARCLMGRAEVVLLDEPASSLNEQERDRLAEVIRSLAASGRAVLLIEHDNEFVMRVSDDIVVLSEGRVVAAGEPGAVRRDPAVIAAYWGKASPV